MPQNTTEYQAFDALALEEKLAHDCVVSNDSFQDGSWDAVIGADPNPTAWTTSIQYRKGYLQGIEEHFNNKYSQLF